MRENQDDQSTPPSHLIESVDHALRLLQLFQTHREVRVTSVAQELGVARSTAHRLLATLAWRGFVAQDRGSKAYRAGQALVEIGLGSISELDIRRKAHRHLEALSTELHETINLLVLEGSGCRFIDGAEGDQPVRVSVRTGTLLPAYATAGGKVLICELSEQEIHDLYPQGLKKLTATTTTSFGHLISELRDVQLRGYALNFDESQVGLRALAVPIKDRTAKTIAALAVSTPTDRLDRANVPQLVEALARTASQISADLP